MLTAFVPLWAAYDLWHSDRTLIKCSSNSALFVCVCVCMCNECAECVNCKSSDFASSLFTFSVPFSVIHECDCVSFIMECLSVCVHTQLVLLRSARNLLCLFFYLLVFHQFFDNRWSSCLFMKCTSILFLKCPPWVSFLFIFYLTIVRT